MVILVCAEFCLQFFTFKLMSLKMRLTAVVSSFNRRLADVMQKHCHTKYGIRFNCAECSQGMLPQIIRMMNVVLIEIEHNGNFRDNNSNRFSVSVKNFYGILTADEF